MRFTAYHSILYSNINHTCRSNLKKTILIYLIFAIIFACQLLFLRSVGIYIQKEILVYLIPINVFLLFFILYLDPFGLFCIILGLLPFSFRGILQVEIGVITFNPYILGMFGLVFITIYKIFIKGYKYAFRSTDFVIILLCFSYSISMLFSARLIESGYLAFHALFVPVVSYFVIKGMISTEEEYKRAVMFFIGGITVFAIITIIVFSKTHTRAFLLSMPSIAIAALTSTAIIYIVYSGWRRLWLRICPLLLVLGALIVSFSRGYLVLLLISPLFFQIIKRGRAFILISVMLSMSLLGTLTLAYHSEVLKPHKYKKELEQSFERIKDINFWKMSLYGRGLYYRDGFNKFLDNPFIGVGPYKGEKAVVRHNFHVEWLEYSGIIGYLLYSFLFLAHFKRVGSIAATDRFCAINLLIIFIILFNGLTNSFTVGIGPYLVFILMGLNEARLRIIVEEGLDKTI